MRPKGILGHISQPYIAALILVAAAAASRAWPLHDLGLRATYITFYPAVMVAALYGGIVTGLLATFVSCLTLAFLWPLFADQPFIRDYVDWLGMAVFAINCALISGITEAMRRSRLRADRTQSELEQRNAELQAARVTLEDEVKKRTAELVQANAGLEEELTKRKRTEEALREVKEHLEIRVQERTADLEQALG